jgi:predicted ATPase
MRSQEALVLAQDLAHPFSMAFARIWAAAIPHQFCREVLQARQQAETAVALSTEHEFGLLEAWGTILRGWALAVQGQSEQGIVQINHGLAAHRTMGSEALLPYFLALLAEAHGKVERVEQGLQLVVEALAVADDHEERFYEAELHRLKGELLLAQSPDNQSEAESCFQEAISIAQRQQAKSWELRAATSLARLWQSQGKRQAAYDLLAPVYGQPPPRRVHVAGRDRPGGGGHGGRAAPDRGVRRSAQGVERTVGTSPRGNQGDERRPAQDH